MHDWDLKKNPGVMERRDAGDEMMETENEGGGGVLKTHAVPGHDE